MAMAVALENCRRKVPEEPSVFADLSGRCGAVPFFDGLPGRLKHTPAARSPSESWRRQPTPA
jgi:hypothetical protein